MLWIGSVGDGGGIVDEGSFRVDGVVVSPSNGRTIDGTGAVVVLLLLVGFGH